MRLERRWTVLIMWPEILGLEVLANIQSGEEAVQGVVYFIGPYQDYQARRALSY